MDDIKPARGLLIQCELSPSVSLAPAGNVVRLCIRRWQAATRRALVAVFYRCNTGNSQRVGRFWFGPSLPSDDTLLHNAADRICCINVAAFAIADPWPGSVKWQQAFIIIQRLYEP